MNKFPFSILALFAILVSLYSCNSGSSGIEEKVISTTNTNTSKIGHVRKPIDTIQAQDVNIGIYDFAAFEPFLTAPNTDTLYVINFWATWCAPCVAELPYFWKAAETFKDKPIKMLFVSLDLKKDYESKLAKFVKERFADHEVIALHEPNANVWIDKVDKNWDGAIPVTLFYKGDKRSFYATELEEMQLNEIIKSFF